MSVVTHWYSFRFVISCCKSLICKYTKKKPFGKEIVRFFFADFRGVLIIQDEECKP